MNATKKNNVRPLHNLADNEGVVPDSFEQQMADLGVPIEKVNQKTAKVLSDWITPVNKGGRQNQDLSLRKQHVSINRKWARKIAESEDAVRVRIALRVIDYDGKPALFIKPDSSGFNLKQPAVETHAWQFSMSPTLRQAIEKHGLKYGSYSLSVIKGGYLAVHDG
jgi:hypothetical protein